MKIAYLSAGISVQDRRFLSKMVEKGHKPYLVSFWNSEVNFKMEGVEFYHYRPRGYLTKLKKIIFLKKLLKKIQPDVVHAGFLQTHGFIGAFVRDFPVLSMPWGSDVLLLPQKSLYYKLVAKFVLRNADMITSDCELVKRKIIEMSGYDPKKIIVIARGTNLNIFHPKESKIRQKIGWENNKILIMTRQFNPVYDIGCFINALPRIIEKFSEVRVILVGKGSLEGEIQQQISSLRLKDYVHFAGFVDENTMAEYLNAADIYVSTSLSDGTSVSLLEAMACQLPVVVSDTPANQEWIKDNINGFIVPMRNSQFLADRLIELLGNSLLCQRMGNRNYDIAQERANWDRNFDKLEAIYKTLCRESFV